MGEFEKRVIAETGKIRTRLDKIEKEVKKRGRAKPDDDEPDDDEPKPRKASKRKPVDDDDTEPDDDDTEPDDDDTEPDDDEPENWP